MITQQPTERDAVVLQGAYTSQCGLTLDSWGRLAASASSDKRLFCIQINTKSFLYQHVRDCGLISTVAYPHKKNQC